MNQVLLEKVWDVIGSERVRQTLIEMVDIYSPSGKEEDIQLYIQGRLEAAFLEMLLLPGGKVCILQRQIRERAGPFCA